MKKNEGLITSWVQNSILAEDAEWNCTSAAAYAGRVFRVVGWTELWRPSLHLSWLFAGQNKTNCGWKKGRRISQCVKWEYLQSLFQQWATLELRIAFYFEVILPTTEHSSVVTQCRANLTQNGCQLPLGTIGLKPQAAIRWLFLRRAFFPQWIWVFLPIR